MLATGIEDVPNKSPGMPFHRIIRGKLKLSADFTAEKPALTQNNSRNDMPFRGKFRLSANGTPEGHAFPHYNLRKVLTFRG
jgi:hypothetical protein